MKDRIVSALERATILGVNDALLHSWYIGENDSSFALSFSIADNEDLISNFDFSWDALNAALMVRNCITMTDNKGEKVDIYLYNISALTV